MRKNGNCFLFKFVFRKLCEKMLRQFYDRFGLVFVSNVALYHSILNAWVTHELINKIGANEKYWENKPTYKLFLFDIMVISPKIFLFFFGIIVVNLLLACRDRLDKSLNRVQKRNRRYLRIYIAKTNAQKKVKKVTHILKKCRRLLYNKFYLQRFYSTCSYLELQARGFLNWIKRNA